MQNKKLPNKIETVQNIILILISFGFYIFFFIFDGAIICADSHTYINMSYSREPFYPAFLALFRFLFGDVNLPAHIGYVNATEISGNLFYLDMAVLAQCLLAATCALSLVLYLRKALKIRYWETLLMLSICLGVSLLCRFAAKRGAMYSNSVLTEGIACSLFLLFIRFLFQYLLEKSRKALSISALLSFILITTRKQMYITLVLLILAIGFSAISQYRKNNGCNRKHHIFNTIGVMLVYSIIVIGANRLFESAYSHCLYGQQFTHSEDNRFVTTMVFYTADRDDGQCIENTELRELFYDIYDICDAEGDLMGSAPEGIYESVSHFGDHYDMIQLDHMQRMIADYVSVHCSGSELEKEEMIDEINSVFIREILPATWTKILYVCLMNAVEGFTNTVAKFSPLFIIYAAVVWLIYIGLMIMSFIKRGADGVNIFALLTFTACLINVAVVGLVIFCQTRYMIYNMPLFYISMWLMIREMAQKPRNMNH